MRTVFEASHSLEGHMVANLLEQANIYARVDGDFLQGGVGELQPSGIVRVVVNDEDFQQAREIVRQWEANQPEIKPSRPHNSAVNNFSLWHLLVTFILGVLVGLLLADFP